MRGHAALVLRLATLTGRGGGQLGGTTPPRAGRCAGPRLTQLAAIAELAITAITLAELSVGPLVARDQHERAARQAHLQQAEADFDPLPFDAAAARAFGRVAATLRHAAPKTAVRAYDAMIAATAIANELPVVTCNPDDFPGIEDLQVVALPVPPPTSPGQASARVSARA